MYWTLIEQYTPVKDKPVLLWGGFIQAEHSGSQYDYNTPVKAYWDGKHWLLSDCVFYSGRILNPTHVAILKKPPKEVI